MYLLPVTGSHRRVYLRFVYELDTLLLDVSTSTPYRSLFSKTVHPLVLRLHLVRVGVDTPPVPVSPLRPQDPNDYSSRPVHPTLPLLICRSPPAATSL